jgi:hypothetical protein
MYLISLSYGLLLEGESLENLTNNGRADRGRYIRVIRKIRGFGKMPDQNNNANGSSDNLASEGLIQNYSQVAGVRYISSEKNEGSELMQGLAETHEQISDDYFAGAIDQTFIRGGQDLAEET